jgi:hypothetical protein
MRSIDQFPEGMSTGPLPRPAITEPCPAWCNAGSHDAEMIVSIGGDGSFNHTAQLVLDDEGRDIVAVAQAEIVHADGTTERVLPATLYLSVPEQIDDPNLAVKIGDAMPRAAAILKAANRGDEADLGSTEVISSG